MTRFVAPLAALTIFACLSQGAAAAPLVDPAYRYQKHGVTLLIHRGAGPIPLADGTTAIDAPGELTCLDPAGCMITFQGLFGIDGGSNPSLSAFVDGTEAKPHAWNDSGTIRSLLQSFRVSQGTHHVQVFALIGNVGTNIVRWEINYTLYDNSVE